MRVYMGEGEGFEYYVRAHRRYDRLHGHSKSPGQRRCRMKPRTPDNSETPAKFSAFQRATPMAVVLTHADRAYSPRPKQQALRDTKGPAADTQFEVRAMAIILT